MVLGQDTLQLSAFSGVSSVAEGCFPKIVPFLGAAHIQFLEQDGVEKPHPLACLGRTLMDYFSSEPHRVSWVCCWAHFAAQFLPLPNPASFPFSSVSQGHSLINNKPHLGYVSLRAWRTQAVTCPQGCCTSQRGSVHTS